MSIKNKLLWCLKKETRMKKIRPNKDLSKKHIKKAKHNLEAMNYNLDGGFHDWVVSQAYYAMYHALLAILFKKGYESKNHECTINTVEYLIEQKQILLNKEVIAIIRTTEQMTNKDAKALREEFQYGTKTSVDKQLLQILMNNAKKIVEQVELSLQD
ncbi:MAG: HEPN domain-containing protein [Nanoarchaeota archaeon]|nr:HEPN domain-containing protein [Nanoarchaeota archaeon]MBU1029725.1 HEPN domain-containing protein [Nanoarchaeota archaeon]MBU1849413.1 HEPN domain-containing protein [Nanoarchaeota archaeon]